MGALQRGAAGGDLGPRDWSWKHLLLPQWLGHMAGISHGYALSEDGGPVAGWGGGEWSCEQEVFANGLRLALGWPPGQRGCQQVPKPCPPEAERRGTDIKEPLKSGEVTPPLSSGCRDVRWSNNSHCLWRPYYVRNHTLYSEFVSSSQQPWEVGYSSECSLLQETK